MSQGGQAPLNLQLKGDSASLDTVNGDPVDGLFPITIRLASTNGVNISKTVRLNTGINSSGSINFTGLINGTYSISYEKVNGFSLNIASPKTLTVTAGVGSATTLTF